MSWVDIYQIASRCGVPVPYTLSIAERGGIMIWRMQGAPCAAIEDAGRLAAAIQRGMSELIMVFTQVEPQMVSEREDGQDDVSRAEDR